MITKFNFKDKTIKSYAIRKLTPKECFRLMGVRDGVIRTMQSTVAEAKERVKGVWDKVNGKDEDMAISSSQQYKMAGNSIVVDVLAAIYEQLWYPEPPKKEAAQQSFFYEFFPEDVLPDMPVDSNRGEKVILTTFSGYDSQLMAADVLRERHPDFRWTCAGWSDIDKYACQMHDLVFPQFADRALGNITKIDWHSVKQSLGGREVDLFTYSNPCQDISQAGKQKGLKEGSDTRSALLWHVADAVEVLRPKFLLQENVAALVSDKFMPDFKKWLGRLEQLGYVNRWARLNAKSYGVPQNRDRVFCLSMRRDVAFNYRFPEPRPLDRCLNDMLEDEVEEKFFLKDNAVMKFMTVNDKDSELFMEFNLPPTHEAAMFLKTWLHQALIYIDAWSKDALMVRVLIENRRFDLMSDYEKFKDNPKALGDRFYSEWVKNMKNKPGDGV